MSNETTVESTETAPEATTPDASEAPRTFTQADIDKIVEDRLARERSKYADYDDLKTKATKYGEVETRVQELERELNQTKYSALKNQIAAETGVPVQMLTGDTEESMREAANFLIEWKGAEKTPSPATRTVNGSGASKTPEVMTPQEKAAAALRGLRGNV